MHLNFPNFFKAPELRAVHALFLLFSHDSNLLQQHGVPGGQNAKNVKSHLHIFALKTPSAKYW
jgi:hypothetical protein